MAWKVVSLETATHEALVTATSALALHNTRERGHEVFQYVRPALPGWCEHHYRYAAVKDYCKRQMDADTKPDCEASNALFSYRKGITVDTPCAVCSKTSIWGCCEMVIIRPCGHVICRRHRPDTKSKCLVCRRKLTSTFVRDCAYAGEDVLRAYYDGFIEEIKYNDWYRTHFYFKMK